MTDHGNYLTKNAELKDPGFSPPLFFASTLPFDQQIKLLVRKGNLLLDRGQLLLHG